MYKISDKYLFESSRIREKYISTLEEITKNENLLNTYKENIKVIVKENQVYVDKNPNKNLEQIKNEIKDNLFEIDSNINKIYSKIDYVMLTLIKKISIELVDEIYDNLFPNNLESVFLIDLKNIIPKK